MIDAMVAPLAAGAASGQRSARLPARTARSGLGRLCALGGRFAATGFAGRLFARCRVGILLRLRRLVYVPQSPCATTAAGRIPSGEQAFARTSTLALHSYAIAGLSSSCCSSGPNDHAVTVSLPASTDSGLTTAGLFVSPLAGTHSVKNSGDFIVVRSIMRRLGSMICQRQSSDATLSDRVKRERRGKAKRRRHDPFHVPGSVASFRRIERRWLRNFGRHRAGHAVGVCNLALRRSRRRGSAPQTFLC